VDRAIVDNQIPDTENSANPQRPVTLLSPRRKPWHVVAASLVTPEKKLSAVKVKSVKKRMKAKEFARSVNRDHIRLCEEIGIPLDEFIGRV
jgi:predicted hydrolase (HD superfamily)